METTHLTSLCVREEQAYNFILVLNVKPPLRSFLGYTSIELPHEQIREYLEVQSKYRAMQETIDQLYDEICHQKEYEWDEW